MSGTLSTPSSSRFAVGQQVIVAGSEHPWRGAIGRIVAPSQISWLDWEIELETVLPGQRAMATEQELRHV